LLLKAAAVSKVLIDGRVTTHPPSLGLFVEIGTVRVQLKLKAGTF
jgi:hypothetical protein